MADARQIRAFKALANEARYEILRSLAADGVEHPCGEFIALLGISPPAVSNHLRILLDAELVQAVHRAGHLYVSLAPTDLAYQMAAIVARATAGARDAH